MTDLEKAARMALEALAASEDFLFNYHDCEPNNEREMDAYSEIRVNNHEAITALLQALSSSVEQPAQQQEPVDWEAVAADQAMTIAIMKVQLEGLPGAEQLPWNKRPWQQIECPVCGELARAEPQRKPWVGLTDEERGEIACNCGCMSADWLDFARAIEAKLKEKNA